MVLFGRDRERHFPDAYLQAGRFGGTDRSCIIDRAEIRSLPPRAIDEAIAFVQKHTLHGAEIGAVRRIGRWSLPLVAAREAVINAVVHTDYAQRGAPLRISIFDDRLEVENPGLLPFGLTVEDLPRGVSKLRNRVIGRVFHALGLIEQWGSGVQRMSAACREAGLSAPVFEELATRFRVTIATARVGRPVLDETDQAILARLAGGKGLLTSEIAVARAVPITHTKRLDGEEAPQQDVVGLFAWVRAGSRRRQATRAFLLAAKDAKVCSREQPPGREAF